MFDFLLKNTQGIFKTFLLKQVRNFKHEEIGYISAFLSLSRNLLTNRKNEIFLLNENEIQKTYEQIYKLNYLFK